MARAKGLTVPRFRSEEEEIEFWKSHDVEDYLTGEVVSVESVFGAPASRPGLLVTLRFRCGVEDRRPLQRHFALPISEAEADRDFGVLFQASALPRGVGPYRVDYHRSVLSWGVGGVVRELVAELSVQSPEVAAEAIALVSTKINGRRRRVRTSTPRGSDARAAQGLPRDVERVVGSIAKWLREHEATELSDDEARAMRP